MPKPMKVENFQIADMPGDMQKIQTYYNAMMERAKVYSQNYSQLQGAARESGKTLLGDKLHKKVMKNKDVLAADKNATKAFKECPDWFRKMDEDGQKFWLANIENFSKIQDIDQLKREINLQDTMIDNHIVAGDAYNPIEAKITAGQEKVAANAQAGEARFGNFKDEVIGENAQSPRVGNLKEQIKANHAQRIEGHSCLVSSDAEPKPLNYQSITKVENFKEEIRPQVADAVKNANIPDDILNHISISEDTQSVRVMKGEDETKNTSAVGKAIELFQALNPDKTVHLSGEPKMLAAAISYCQDKGINFEAPGLQLSAGPGSGGP